MLSYIAYAHVKGLRMWFESNNIFRNCFEKIVSIGTKDDEILEKCDKRLATTCIEIDSF